jgi:hypothetical protein
VLEEDADAGEPDLQPSAHSQESSALCGLGARVREVRLPFLVYETVVIPLRAAFPEVFELSIAAILLDVIVDVVEVTAIAQRVKSRVAPAGADAGPGDDPASAGVVDDATGRRPAPYSMRRAALDVASIVALYVTRIIYAQTGKELPFVLAQIVRCVRVYDLLNFVREINSDLSTSVRLLAFSKFFLVLIISPHYVACTWVIVSGGWHLWDRGQVELPSWPAQFLARSRNPQMDPNTIDHARKCTRRAQSTPRCAPPVPSAL